MKRRLAASALLGLAMLGAAALTGALTPTLRMAQGQERFSLEAMIPRAFGDWELDAAVVPLQADPGQRQMLERLYDQTLSRTYVDRDGQRVMLSIAYGGDQSRALQLHLPEVCYVAQGFDLLKSGHDTLDTGYGAVPVKRLVARQNLRNEPITYWITVGEQAARPGVDQKLRRFAYGLSGKIPDGMLVRVSTIHADERAAYRIQDRFARGMLAAVGMNGRARLLGLATADKMAGPR